MFAVQNVELPPIYEGLKRVEREAVAVSALEMVGLVNRAHHDPSEVSGGQQQRVAIARALAGAPRILLADEPTCTLDTHMSAEIMELLRDLDRREGQTIVMVAHEDDMAHCADRLIWMVDGWIEPDGPTASHGTGTDLAG